METAQSSHAIQQRTQPLSNISIQIVIVAVQETLQGLSPLPRSVRMRFESLIQISGSDTDFDVSLFAFYLGCVSNTTMYACGSSAVVPNPASNTVTYGPGVTTIPPATVLTPSQIASGTPKASSGSRLSRISANYVLALAALVAVLSAVL
jgi:hypothetical protein